MPHKNAFWALHGPMAEGLFASMEQKAQAEAPFSEHSQRYAMQDGVAVIAIDGAIERDAWWFGTSQSEIRASLEAAMADPAAKAILLSIDSPGGVVAGTKELADFIASCARQKPMAAYADGLCASAAYWLASATGRIYGPITAQIGSIGVICVHTCWKQADKDAGITRTVIYSGKWKAAGSPDKELTEDERELFQNQLDGLHAIFRADVERFMRPMGDDWAEGQVFLADEAQKRRLITKVVQDKSAAIGLLARKFKETVMDLKQLKADYPDLLAEHEKEVLASRPSDREIAAETQKNMLEFVKAGLGEAAADKLGKILAAGVSPEQYRAVMALAPEPSASPQKTEAEIRREILASLQEAHGDAVIAGKKAQDVNPLLADAERRSLK